MSFTAKAAKSAKDENELSRSILDAAFRVHSAVGPGLLERLKDGIKRLVNGL
jgi:hypothetical protein